MHVETCRMRKQRAAPRPPPAFARLSAPLNRHRPAAGLGGVTRVCAGLGACVCPSFVWRVRPRGPYSSRSRALLPWTGLQLGLLQSDAVGGTTGASEGAGRGDTAGTPKPSGPSPRPGRAARKWPRGSLCPHSHPKCTQPPQIQTVTHIHTATPTSTQPPHIHTVTPTSTRPPRQALAGALPGDQPVPSVASVLDPWATAKPRLCGARGTRGGHAVKNLVSGSRHRAWWPS